MNMKPFPAFLATYQCPNCKGAWNLILVNPTREPLHANEKKCWMCRVEGEYVGTAERNWRLWETKPDVKSAA